MFRSESSTEKLDTSHLDNLPTDSNVPNQSESQQSLKLQMSTRLRRHENSGNHTQPPDIPQNHFVESNFEKNLLLFFKQLEVERFSTKKNIDPSLDMSLDQINLSQLRLS